MPRQTSLIKIRGKADGNSFYYSKNGGNLVRSINTNMSQRVKTDPAYALVRANAAEFGSMGMLLGQMVSAMPYRGHYFLNPIIPGTQVKRWLPYVQAGSGVVGQRVLTQESRKELWPSFNRYSKNPIPETFANNLYPGCIQVQGTAGAAFIINNQEGLTIETSKTEFLRSKGATHIGVQVSILVTVTPEFDTSLGKFIMPGSARWQDLSSRMMDLTSEESYYDAVFPVPQGYNLRDTSKAQAIGFTFYVYKKIGSSYIRLNDLTSFACFQPEG